jgi:hypothetical protein
MECASNRDLINFGLLLSHFCFPSHVSHGCCYCSPHYMAGSSDVDPSIRLNNTNMTIALQHTLAFKFRYGLLKQGLRVGTADKPWIPSAEDNCTNTTTAALCCDLLHNSVVNSAGILFLGCHGGSDVPISMLTCPQSRVRVRVCRSNICAGQCSSRVTT